MTRQNSMGDILEQLVADGYISDLEAVQFEEDSPEPHVWFIQILLGLGGWIAAFFFFLFAGTCLSTLDLDEFAFAVISVVIGTVLMVATTFIRTQQIPGPFTRQFSLAILVAGQFLFLLGIIILLEEYDLFHLAIVAGIMMIVESILIYFYEDSIFRFLGFLAWVTALNALMYDLTIPGGISLIIIFLGWGLISIWGGLLKPEQWIRFRPILIPIGYALAVGLAGTIAHELANTYEEIEFTRQAIAMPLVSSALLTGMVLWIVFRTIERYIEDENTRFRIFASIVGITILIAIPTLSTSGIMAGFLLMILGYRRKNPILLGLSYSYIACFISYFYYSLNMTLLTKSIILMATGLLILIVRIILQRLLPIEPHIQEEVS